ncbi:dihydropteridine reductase [Acetobacter sp. DmW_043]|uniref:NO-inducible flavohemoprotein n=1 Tax=Acetobacter sp. DmW_043 TaxID=1670658 RepID=UPI000A3944FE|nr:NO-inducible flavohemoprotein [Acetobacter sp. DmW_043]OUI88251.1 dihydropteridine reductase [Acetobacter sp. DmW_043]
MTASLDDQTRAIVTACIPALEAHGLDITREMYSRLLADPAIAELFNRSHQKSGEQPTALAMAVLAYARHINDLGTLTGMIERIAEKHVGLNILPEHYPHVGQALLGAIAHVLGDAATPEIMQAWGNAYQFLADVLMNRESQLYKEKEEAPGGWRGWRAFTIRQRVAESGDVTSFRLEPTDGKPVVLHKPGQYLTFNITVPGEGSQRRNYSISSAPDSRGYRISVKRAAGGLVSGWLHDHAKEGTELLVSAPAGTFTLPEETANHPVVLLSAGVGLTPFIAMAEAAHKAGRKAPLHYVHGTHTPQSEAFGPRVRELAKDGTVQADIFYTRKNDTAAAGQNVQTHEGHISAAWLKAHTPADALYYLCGPDAFMQSVIAGLKAEGVPESRIKHEVFGSASTPEDALHAA